MCLTESSGSLIREISIIGPHASSATPQDRRQLLQAQVARKRMSIEEYLLITDPYRCSTANARFPVPFKLNQPDPSLTQKLQEDKGLRGLIFDSLTDHGIGEADFEFYNVSKPAYPNGGDIQVSTLMIYVDVNDDVSTVGWLPASRFLHNLLSERGYRGVCVEIQDCNRYFQPSLFPLSPGDEAVKSYETVRKALIKIVRKWLQNSWSMMSVFKVGRDSAQAIPMIVVMVQPLARQRWWKMKKQMEKSTRLGIEFVIGSCQSSNPLETTFKQPGRNLSNGFTPWPKLGCSIGVEGEQGGGTLGGLVILSCGGKEHRGILTCAHFVEPPNSAGVLVKRQADREGTRYRDQASELTKTNVHYFAQKDVDATTDSVQSRILFLRKSIEEFTNLETMRTMMGDEPKTGTRNRINIQKRELDEFESMLPTLERMPIAIGRVLISSGKAISIANSALDWAFVEVDARNKEIFDNPDRNALPLSTSAGIYERNASNYGNHVNYSVMDGRNQIRGFAEVRKGHWYFKVGRTTALTTGICHGTEVYCNIIGIKHRTKYDETNMRSTRKRVDYTEELVIMNRMTGQAIHEQRDFCQPGDLGSWLIDADSCVAGLLFGSITGFCGSPNKDQPGTGFYVNAGLVTSMTGVQKSIAAWTTPRDSNGAPTDRPVFSLYRNSLWSHNRNLLQHGSDEVDFLKFLRSMMTRKVKIISNRF